MKQAKNKSRKKKAGKGTAPVQSGSGEKGNLADEGTGYGILPDRDLKKNLGCG